MRFRTFATITAVLTFSLILLGGYVKAIGAGAYCNTEWPKCHGEWFPLDKMSYRDWAEWTHRLVASITGFLILGVAVWAWRTERANKPVFWSAMIAAILLPMQIVMGGVTVLTYLMEDAHVQAISVVGHLGFAALIFAATVTTVVLAHLLPTPARDEQTASPTSARAAETASPTAGDKARSATAPTAARRRS